MPATLIPYLAYLIALVICGLAYWRGDQALKLASVALLVSWTLTPLVSNGSRISLDYPVTIVDTNAALVFVWISLRWRRLWCAVLSALTIIIVIIPIVSLVDRDIHRYNNLAANNVVAMSQLVVLLLGTWLTVRGRRRRDEDAVRPQAR